MFTGFTGIFFLDGSNATIEDAAILAENIPLPQGFHIEARMLGSLALAVAYPGNLDNSARRFIFSDDTDYLFTGAGSVYNIHELVSEMKLQKTPHDVELMKDAWLKWRKNSSCRLDGDWMFAAYDKASNELLLTRSWGYSSLYYRMEDRYIAFSTNPRALVNIKNKKCKPDMGVISQILCAKQIAPDASCWHGMHQLQPASQLEISLGKAKEIIWWRPSEIKPIHSNDCDDIILEQFIHLYRKAVSKRLRTEHQIGATISAGLDSSSLSILAAHELLNMGKTLHLWTSVPHFPEEAYSFSGWLADERELAAKAASVIKNKIHFFTDAAESNPIDIIYQQVLNTGKPQRSGANLYWLDSILTDASRLNCKVMLIGQFGNSTVSWTPQNISLGLKSRFYPETSWYNYVRILKNSMAKHMVKVKKDISDKVKNKEKNYPVMNPAFIDSEIFKLSIRNTVNKKYYNQAEAAEAHMGLFDLWYHNSFCSGVEVRDPTMDLELTRFLLSLPDNMYFRDGMNRRVIRLGMKGIMPDENRLNKCRGQQASDILPRVRQFGQHAADALSYIKSSQLARSLLNLDEMNRVLQCIRQGETGIRIMRECTGILLPGLSIGFFLALFDSNCSFR